MSIAKGLKCRECGRKFPKEALYVCEYCFGPLEVEYDYERIKALWSKDLFLSRPKNMFRYKELLPLDAEPKNGFFIGFTPLIHSKQLGKYLGLPNLYIKDDSVNYPTLSFKDRVVSVALSKAIEFGFNVSACASTGNLANAVAAHSAIMGLQSYIFIPADLEISKIIATSVYHPNVVAVEGNYDEVNRLCAEIATRKKWAFVNVNIRPYYAEGSKTFGFEIVEQLGWKPPDHIIVPAASGSLICKIKKAIQELKQVGMIGDENTKMSIAQAGGCAPIVNAILENSEFIKPVKPNTIVKSLAIGNPADGIYATRVVKQSGGWASAVSDEKVIDGIKLLAKTEGIFTETAGGVTVSALCDLLEQGKIKKQDTVVLSITGNGLKTFGVLDGKLKQPFKIKPKYEEFEKVVGGNK